MDAEIDDMRRYNVFREVPRPLDTNVITPRGVFIANLKTAHLLSTRHVS